MEDFRIVSPSELLRPYVRHYWFLKTSFPAGERTVPTGCIHLIFHRERGMYSETDRIWQPRSFVSGQSSGFSDLRSAGAVDMVVVVFQPCAAGYFLPVPPDKLREENVSVEELEDLALRELAWGVEESSDEEAVRLIEAFLLSRLNRSHDYHFKRMRAAVEFLSREPELTVAGLSERIYLSTKQLNRVFSERVGAGPKEYMRIIRFQRALFLLQGDPGMSFVQLAYESGYFDQSHMIRDFKRFSGYTPGEYLAFCHPYSDYFTEV